MIFFRSAGRARIQNLRYQETFAKQLAKSSHLQPQPQFAPYRQPLDDLDHQHMVDTLQSEQQADAAFDRQFQEVMVFGKKNNEHKKVLLISKKLVSLLEIDNPSSYYRTCSQTIRLLILLKLLRRSNPPNMILVL